MGINLFTKRNIDVNTGSVLQNHILYGFSSVVLVVGVVLYLDHTTLHHSRVQPPLCGGGGGG